MPRTEAGAQAWALTEACQTQVRLSAMGHPYSWDLGAVIAMGTAMGFDMEAVAPLLPAVEAGLLEAWAPAPEG